MAKKDAAPRRAQAEILNYTQGKMGISAVPGSGKTWTLARLAAKLVRETKLGRGQQILIVTLVNAARGKFEQQVRDFLGEDDPGTSYRVRTLHGLANDIVSERPGLVGLAEDFQILDEDNSNDMIEDAVTAYVRAHPAFGAEYVQPEQAQEVGELWREEAVRIASAFIKQAKDERKTPEMLRRALEHSPATLPLAEMCVSVYLSYEHGLRYRGAVDFQDLIRLALTALEADLEFLLRLRARWPIILEDEAQDSSRLQEEILRRLAGERGNWVRVGDPNQAIYESFTTASPTFLRAFLRETGVTARELPESGRSTRRIIGIANQLINWSLEHPIPEIRVKMPLDKPYIQPLDQGNPPDSPDSLVFAPLRMSSGQERMWAARSAQQYMIDHPDKTVAMLLPTNASGAAMANLLRKENIDYVEHLRTTSSTRKVVGGLWRVLGYLAEPTRTDLLAETYKVWQRDQRDSSEVKAQVRLLSEAKLVEQFTSPQGQDWLEQAINRADAPEQFEQLAAFREQVMRWQEASLLPVDQLLLTVSGDLFNEPADIATGYSLALYMRGYSDLHPHFRLAEFVNEMERIAANRRKFTGLSDDDEQFDPSRYKGRAVIMTLHGAKGLEWDRVYLMSVSNYDFPSVDLFDNFIGESWFVRDRLNLQAEALAQLQTLISERHYREGDATAEARIDYAAERLRLLYVGITRAREELYISWNTGKRGDMQEAKPLTALREWWMENAGG
ncbi:MAG: ATP-dependent helicase [Anaerolineae bacterium]|nr:ATP-dependent helicase [Anaerolineae bacterium]